MRPLHLAALTAALVVLPATAAAAHPSFTPNVVPVGEPVETVLVVPHGCSTSDGVVPGEGQSVPTTRFDLQLLDGITVEPREVEGWVAEDDGEAIVWTADGGATSDPIEFPLTLTVTDGTAGDQLDIAAHQECEDGSSYRWTVGSEGTPAVRLELTEGDADTVDVADGGHGADRDSETPSAVGTPTETPSGPPSTDAPSEQSSGLDVEFTADDDASTTVIVIAVVAVALAVALGVALVVRRRSA